MGDGWVKRGRGGGDGGHGLYTGLARRSTNRNPETPGINANIGNGMLAAIQIAGPWIPWWLVRSSQQRFLPACEKARRIDLFGPACRWWSTGHDPVAGSAKIAPAEPTPRGLPPNTQVPTHARPPGRDTQLAIITNICAHPMLLLPLVLLLLTA